MERHAQKDREAGGEGLGVLVTRKRCWRDEDGNITTKRPASSVAAVGKALEAQRRRRCDSSDESGSGSGGDNIGGPTSPSYSSRSSSHARKDDLNAHNVPETQDSLRKSHYQVQLGAQLRSISDGSLITPTPPSQLEYQPGLAIQGVASSVVGETHSSRQITFDDLSSIDTAQSFDTSLIALNNYNWLFAELRTPENSQDVRVPFDQSSVTNLSQVDENTPMESVYGDDETLPSLVSEYQFPHFEGNSLSQRQHKTHFIHQNPHGPEQHLDQRPAGVIPEQQIYFLNNHTNTISPVFGNISSDTIDIDTIQETRQIFKVFENTYPQQHIHKTTSQVHYHYGPPSSPETYCTSSVSPRIYRPLTPRN